MADDDKAPWTVKAVPAATRELALRQARQTGQTVGEWLAVAVQRQADFERRTEVLPPGRTGRTVARVDAPPAVPVDLAALAQAVGAVTAAATAAVDAPALRGLSRDLAGLLRDQVRQARGLAPVGRRRGGREPEDE